MCMLWAYGETNIDTHAYMPKRINECTLRSLVVTPEKFHLKNIPMVCNCCREIANQSENNK